MDDDDLLDGCDLDFTVEPDDDETASLRPLYPSGASTDMVPEGYWRWVAEQQS